MIIKVLNVCLLILLLLSEIKVLTRMRFEHIDNVTRNICICVFTEIDPSVRETRFLNSVDFYKT